jgi:hypothetical protein
MNRSIHPAARSEYLDAVAHYKKKAPSSIVLDFEREIDNGISAIIEAPGRWQQATRLTRRYPLKNFPYRLIYAIRPDEIHIVAVAHTSRKPFYWRSRLK